MRQSSNTLRGRALSGCFLLLCSLALSGCFQKTVIRGPDQVPPQRPGTGGVSVPTGISAEAAEAAYNAGQTARAEQIAMQLFSRQTLSGADTARVGRILALSAAANNHPYLAINGLERWIKADASAESSEEWQRVFLETLGQLPPRDAATRAQTLMAETSRPFALRSGAALFLASRQWERPAEAPQALANIRAFYDQGSKNQKTQMEHTLFSFLRNVGDPSLATLDALVNDENSKTYPHAIIRLESLRRRALHAATREEAQAGAAALADDTALADPSILRRWDAVTETPAITIPLSGRTLVLALPLSGTLGGIGKKIVQGAEEARAEFSSAGYAVNLVMLDTQDASWMERLESLPPQATIVGGPLRLDRFAAANARGLTRNRAFLTFLPGLGDGGEEGRVAWRFFPSAEDQLVALFSATRKLGITQYAILMPTGDSYASRMADLFTAYARRTGAQVVHRAEYPHKEQEKWNKFVGSFLGSHKKASSAPSVSHRAIFLPDAWANMELIVPNLFYFMESRQLLLGTSLWEQGLSADAHVTAHYYNLAVFPGAWDKTASLSQAGARLQGAYAKAGLGEPDFWAGLGYDFVRFASTLDVQPGWTASTVNALLSRNTDMAWSMAPLRWSSQGVASQDLFLFTPVSGGLAPADMTEIEARFNKAWNR